MWYEQKRQKKPIKRAQFGIFTPYFSKVWAFRILQPPKWHLVLKVLEDNEMFYSSRRALHASTARNKREK